MKTTIIAIHGVGETHNTSIIKSLGNNLGLGKLKLEKFFIGENEYYQTQNSSKNLRIVESNWSDILKPKSNWYSIFRHLAMLISSMFSILESDYNSKDKRINSISIFRIMIEGFVLGAIILPIISGIAAEAKFLEFKLQSISMMAGIGVLFGFIIFKGISYSKYYKYGIIHLLIIAAIIFNAVFDNNFSLEINNACNLYRFVVLTTISCFWLVWVIHKLSKLRKNKDSNYKVLSDISFITLPYIAFNSLATALTLLYLMFFNSKSVFQINFNLKAFEIAGTIGYIIIGIIPLVFAVLYFLHKKKTSNGTEQIQNTQGQIAQWGIKCLLWITPLVFISISICGAILLFQQEQSNESILDIYKVSIIRLIPFLSWFIGPLAIIVDVIGDVLFYLNPDVNSKCSIQNECKQRLRAIIEHIRIKNDSDILILAHSWGTIVANDVLSSGEYRCKLITLGSPLESLCKKILGRNIKELDNVEYWINAYRNGDYISGPINKKNVKNINIEEGGHTNYWSSNAIKRLLIEQLKN